MNLILFHRWHCPYSKRVRDFIEENQLQFQINFHEIEEEVQAREKLVRLTGGQQVPCLVINGRPKLQTEKIIEWLKKNMLTHQHFEST
jgi:glutaredoxin 3